MADKIKNIRKAVLTPEFFAHQIIIWWLPILYLLISSLFYLRTYDSAQVKISVMQMGGLALLTLWACRLVESGRAAFSKEDLVCLSPFLAYLLVGILSFIHAPYHMASVDFFLRHFFFMTVALILIYEFNQPAADRLTRILIWTGWIAVGYGFLQFVDVRFFPPGVGKGLDPFIWRGAFSLRIFSTYGNPNFFADFLVILFPILLTQWLKTRRWSLLPLMTMLLIDLIATGTKGAWLGFAIVLAIFGIITAVYFKKLLDSFPLNQKIVNGALSVLGLALGALAIRQGLKHQWVTFGFALAGAAAVVAVYALRTINSYTRVIVALLAAAMFGFVGYVAKDLQTRLVSVNFRLFTWEATWEMIRTQPLIGTGIGSFPPIYPAFRRPAIFHIEGKHNTETDHSEDEYLEQLFDNGILGFGVFLWLIVSTLVVGFRSLGQLTGPLALKDGRPHPRAYDLIGYMVAFMGMLGHNFFDVSLRFVSSGVYLGLLSGMIVNLARGQGLYELHEARETAAASGPAAAGAAPGAAPAAASAWRTLSEFLIWPARLLAWASLIYIIAGKGWTALEKLTVPPGSDGPFGGILGQFVSLQGPLSRLSVGGEVLQWWLAWAVLAGCVLTLGFMLARLVYLSENPVVPLLVAAAIHPMFMFWGYFKADIHHNIAIFYSKERRWDEALLNYAVVHELNPDFVMSLYFTGNVFNDRFNMEKIYNSRWGDVKDQPRDDYERALSAYNEVRRLAPNYVQMHHQVGALHMKRAEWAMNHGQPEEAQRYLELALNRFRLYEQIDPVFPQNFYRMGQVYMIQKKWPEAVKAYEDFIKAEKCSVAPNLMAKPMLRSSILSYQDYISEPGNPLPVHRHESAEGYTNLANAHFMLEHLNEAEDAYKKALVLDGNFQQARQNLNVVYNKAQQVGRLRKLPGPPPLPLPGAMPYTGYEILPAGR